MRDDPIDRLRRANPHPGRFTAPDYARLRPRIIDSLVAAPNAGQLASRVRHTGRVVLTVASCGLAVAVAVAALLFVGHHAGHVARTPSSHPATGGLPPVPENTPANHEALRLINQYQLPAMRDRACRSSTLLAGGRPEQGLPSRQVLTRFAVLRLPATRRGTAPHAPLLGRIYVRDVRIARRAPGGGTIEVYPARRVGGISGRCANLLLDAVKAKVASAPVRLRGRVLRLARQQLQDQRYAIAHPDQVCVDADGGATCGAILQVEQEGQLLSGGDGSGSAWWYLVPDGVASVTVRYPARPRNNARNAVKAAVTVTAKVIDNVALWKLREFPGDVFPNWIQWHDRSGRVIHTVYPG